MQVHSQPAGGGSDPPKEPEKVTVNSECRMKTLGTQRCQSLVFTTPTPPDAEVALDSHCWIPLGIQLQSVGPEGGKLCLEPSAGATGGKEEETVFLEVPPGAVRPSETVEVHYAVIPSGPFTLPEGYQFGSMVVYIYYDSRRVTSPLRLLLPHWCDGEDHTQNGLSFAIAPHSLKEGEHLYHFQLLKGGRRLSNHCGELEIDGHCSLFAEVFKKGAMSSYQAIALQRERGNEVACDVVVTYAFPLWCNVSYTHLCAD